MGVRDWPPLAKSAARWAIVFTATFIFGSTSWLLLQPVVEGRVLELGDTPWLNLLGRYSAIITAPVAIATALGLFGYLRKKGDTNPLFYYLAGVAVGVVTGIFLIPLTGGFSLICAPPVATITMMLGWLVRRPRRTVPANPPTPAP